LINYVFESGSWNHKKDVCIFDNKYISENIYSEESLDTNKQEKIVSIILGDKGIELEMSYSQAKEALDENKKKRTEITNQYNSAFNKDVINFKEFRGYTEKRDIDKQIIEIDKKLQAIGNQLVIKDLLNSLKDKLNIINKIRYDDLSRTIEVEQGKIKTHILGNFNKKSYEGMFFLEKGTSLLKEDHPNCVFCGQKIVGEAEQLIDSYKILFSETYKQLNESVNMSLSFFREFFVEQVLLEHKNKFSSLGVDVELDAFNHDISELKSYIISDLEKKQINLNFNIDFDKITKLVHIIDEIIKDKIDVLIKIYSETLSVEAMKHLISDKNRFEMFQGTYIGSLRTSCLVLHP